VLIAPKCFGSIEGRLNQQRKTCTRDKKIMNDEERKLRIKEFGEGFGKYEQALRTWFIAYGIGGPVLFLTQPCLREKLLANPDRFCIGILFLTGIFFQIIITFLYKMITWYPYYREFENDSRKCWWYTFSDFVNKHYSIDVVIDLLTIGVFSWATILAFRIIMN
jgi:hypothetical protein